MGVWEISMVAYEVLLNSSPEKTVGFTILRIIKGRDDLHRRCVSFLPCQVCVAGIPWLFDDWFTGWWLNKLRWHCWRHCQNIEVNANTSVPRRWLNMLLSTEEGSLRMGATCILLIEIWALNCPSQRATAWVIHSGYMGVRFCRDVLDNS